ncbi:elongation factor EF-Ts [Candidatus Carsonella ruddii]|uniref:Putative elongation factor EF-Ts n=1 Tax=Candidatus Carsonella ruddii PC isolate NHV TaxID=1202540 RepID=J3YQL1_CARRU|nr:elongation factor EF-Ts [Candidatus Carsonella ruddii]AFP84248.1 putative elongation factor EF-Ts [Candidatus Carsonella ruddii PC isolate NHV]
MLNLIIQLRKKTGISINLCKNFLIKNNWNFNNTIKYIEKNKTKSIKKLNNYSVISLIKNKKIYVLKISYNSIIINNSNIIKNLINNFENQCINKKIIIKILKILSIKLNENVFLEFYFNLINKNLELYNHKNLLMCLVKLKNCNILSEKRDLCYQIISKKIKFIKLKKCIFSIYNQNNIKTNIKFDKFLINEISYFIYINNKKIKFLYE